MALNHFGSASNLVLRADFGVSEPFTAAPMACPAAPDGALHEHPGGMVVALAGEPHLEIREPNPFTRPVSKRLHRLNAKRLVNLHGDWHLWICFCDWRIYSKEKLLAHSESSRRIIKHATYELDGQALVRVTVSKSLVTVFAINRVVATFDEKSRRRFVGLLALQLGRGGLERTHEITGVSRTTIRVGRDEIRRRDSSRSIRQAGGGRVALEKSDLKSWLF